MDHFRLIAPYYDRIFGNRAHPHLHALLQLPTAGWLLDAGGGTGRLVRSLGATERTVVVDISRPMLAQARRKGLPAIQAAVEALPFRDGAFDRVLIVDAFHHLGDQYTAATELLRMLGSRGRLVIQEPDIRHPLVRLVAWGERLLLMRSRFRPSRWLRELFERHGAYVQVEHHGAMFWLTVERC